MEWIRPRNRIVSFAALLLVSLSAPAGQRGLLPADYYSEITVSEVALSPDGNFVASTRMIIDEDDNKRHREIWVQPLRNARPDGEPVRFTSPATEASTPVWSQDGSVLSFQSRRGDGDDAENTTWFIRVGGIGGEAYRIDGVDGTPVWSPDGNWIAYTKEPEEEESESPEREENPDESKEDSDKTTKRNDEREGWVSPDTVTTTLNPKRFDGRVYTTMSMKRDGTLTLLPHRSARNKRQLFIVPAEGGAPVQVTDLNFDAGSLEWTPDSQTILFSGDPLQDDEFNEDYTQQIYSIARAGGEPVPLTQNPGAERAHAVSPDGKKLAYLYSAERGAPTDLMVVNIDPGGTFQNAPRNLTADWDLSPRAPVWSGNSRSIRFQALVNGNSHVFAIPASGGEVHQITEGDRYIGEVDFASDGNVMAYTVTTPSMPAELFVSRQNGKNEVQLTDFNAEWLEEITLVPPERITYTVADGSAIQGWLIKPVGYNRGESCPMILKIHGGPHSAYGNYWFRTFHLLSNAGFFVLYTNPRGSAGYSHGFTYATQGKWGELDSEDYLAGVDAALALYPDIDPDRIGVSGGSYGGFMTAWLTATTDRFAAANPSRMISNWESWYGASDAQRLTEHEFFGEPWEARETYRRLSPISYVENVEAPTLIIQSEHDYRTPMADAEQWYMALKKRGVPAELVRYPRSSHGLSRTGEPWLLVDRLERIRSWFVYWLIDNPDKNPAIGSTE